MGQNLVLNMNDHGYTVAVFNRTTSKVDDFLAGNAKGTHVIGAHSVAAFTALLKRPRRVMLMIKAGSAVDAFIEQLLPHLEEGDIIIDGGNSNYVDSIRRAHYIESNGLLFVGTGVSGGEEGARYGPSIMPGGSPQAWPHVRSIFQDIAAKVEGGAACCDWVGHGGAGHFVKMVHNGIEYGDMQIIAEAYFIMKHWLGLTNKAMSEVFGEWNTGKLDSYLIEITRDILAYKDEDGHAAVDYILDSAGQKGTGKWTAAAALDMGIPLTLIGEAVFARFLSALKNERVAASEMLTGPRPDTDHDQEQVLLDLRDTVYAAKIMSYAQGYMLMQAAAAAYSWKLNYGGIALMWRGGCIIRSAFLARIKEAFANDPSLDNLLLAPYFQREIADVQPAWRRIVAQCARLGFPTPAISSALAFYDGLRHGRGSANLIQAQRDYFGAHTYARIDRSQNEAFHTNWTGSGGDVTAGTYQA